MKRRNLCIAILFLIPAFGMAQHELSTGTKGSIIDNDMAKTWLENFKTQKVGEIEGFTYGKETLQEILSASNAAGLRVSYGLDKNQNLKFVLHSVDSMRTDTEEPPYDDGAACPPNCPEDPNPIIGDGIAKIGNKIRQKTADNWMSAYAKANPDQVQSYLFDKPVIEDILDQPEGKGLYFARGLDQHGKERMILIAVSGEGTLMMDEKIGADSEQVFIAMAAE